MSREEDFFSYLKDLFAYQRVRGKSGLIKAKEFRSLYFKRGLPRLKEELNRITAHAPEYREELYQQLHSLFSSVLINRSIFPGNTAPKPSKAHRQYTAADRDIQLFWQTHRFYYVKTDRLIDELEVEVDGAKIVFDVSELKENMDHKKKPLSYRLLDRKEDCTLTLAVSPADGRGKKADDLVKQLNEKGVQITAAAVKQAISLFEQQMEMDLFIYKDPRNFLEEQCFNWINQQLWKDFSGEQVKKLQLLREAALKIISFISRFKEELLHIWLKPKYILNSNYVITLDQIADRDLTLLKRLLSHPGIRQQTAEWKELRLVGDSFQTTELMDVTQEKLSKRYAHLPLDTRYFKDCEGEILSLFDHLDKELDGWLIKSENYQALNTILPKFKEKVQMIYIDPPFNREQEPGYSYSVKYRDAAWLSLLENRLQLAHQTLNKKGSIFVRCDYNGNMYVRLLLDQIFGPECFKNEIIIKRSGIQKEAKNKFLVATDSLFYYTKSNEGKPKVLYEQRETGWLPFVHYPGLRKNKERLVFGCTLEPPEGRHWGLKQELIEQWKAKGWVRFRCKKCGYEHYEGRWANCPDCGSQEFLPELKNPPKKVDSNWTNISSYSQDPLFPTRNAEDLLKRVIEAASDEGDLVMDFFLGSGTTTAVAHKMRRKWIGVEMGEHFYTYVLPRMKKVLAGERSGISRKVGWQGGGFFKYCELEQFEDVLCKAEYGGTDKPFHYGFLADRGKGDSLKKEWDFSLPYEGVDLPATLSCLKGEWIEKISANKVLFEKGDVLDMEKLDPQLLKPLLRW
ncbi:MAG TPA: site-specific DNA-methyltransferase [Syntrophaceticus sp.]|nr:site-specific DNA-methyltransferase [Syntrophaceticus sp.]